MSPRGISPVVGVVCLLAVTVILAATVVVTVPVGSALEPTVASFEATADPTGEIRVTHTGGDVIDPESVDVHVRVDGEPLAQQPPVPFFSARGFESAPTGAFNSATAGDWRVGETASFRTAGTNEPGIDSGDTVTIRLYVNEYSVTELDVRA
ncbi:type IV pilin [Natronomonas sp. LN261]|uniref:type IV pilin n=1 Tax=Natronomonas sp. LN261 TaxID=2750669 RepID=UPI0015EF87DA|nr:type IV pilin N-terminal domain-containing protein [Natronomonas sp. LN261]